MICNHTSDTLSVAAAGLFAALVAVTLPAGPVSTVMPANASAIAPAEPTPPLHQAAHGATPISALGMRPATSKAVGLGAGGCGERKIRVFDAAAGGYRTRTASVCWRTIL